MDYEALYNEQIKINNDLSKVNKRLLNKIKDLSRQAYTDELTKLYNRFGMKRILSLNECDYAMLFIDIDNFKEINDKYGHDYGDIILIEIANILKRNVFTSDFVVRLGGDEFIIFFREINVDKIYKKGLTIKDNIALIKTPSNIPLTFSGGVTIHKRDDNIMETIKKVDYALYKSKQNGKNKITIID